MDIKQTYQRVAEYAYKATNLAAIVGGLLSGHGLGGVASRGDISDWAELAIGLLITSGSLIYRFRNMDKYDPQICEIKNEISRSEAEISKLEDVIRGIKDNYSIDALR